MLSIERFKQALKPRWSLETTQLSQEDLFKQISEDVKSIRRAGTLIAIASLPWLAGSCVVSYGLSHPPANVDWNAYVQTATASAASLIASAGALYLGLYLREKANEALNFIQTHPLEQ